MKPTLTKERANELSKYAREINDGDSNLILTVSNSFVNEDEFNLYLGERLRLRGYSFSREVKVGACGVGNLGYIDFISEKEGWFAECKLNLTTSDIAHALGQCLFYRHFLPRLHALIVCPCSSQATAADSAILARLCWDHQVVLTTDYFLQDELAAITTHQHPVAFNLK